MLKGRLGLETARIPHVDRHGLLWLGRSQITVENGTLKAVCAGWGELPAGVYDIPFQMVSVLLLAPGCTISHDVMRLCARHGTGIIAVGEDGTRSYTFPPLSPDRSQLARAQARCWADPSTRVTIARAMFAMRFDQVLPSTDINVLRGIEGARIKESYKQIATQYRVPWSGRKYDPSRPEAADSPNQAINHVATAVAAAAWTAVAAVGAIPQLGFIHEDSGGSFVLDIADLYRTEVTFPVAMQTVVQSSKEPHQPLERIARRCAGAAFRKHKLITAMIDRIKLLFQDHLRPSDPADGQTENAPSSGDA
ncbi:MAG: type I-E CRISPR-associated endonuclease Cas1 [Planctomycetota bacterium]|nr:MAG: type I-E CRISPR-associated endonuclease Cas1 [Planctomycetota bacterium]